MVELAVITGRAIVLQVAPEVVGISEAGAQVWREQVGGAQGESVHCVVAQTGAIAQLG